MVTETKKVQVTGATPGAVVAKEAAEEMVWVYYPAKEEREKNNDGSPGKLIMDKDGRYPNMITQAPRLIPRSAVAQAKSQGWYTDPKAKVWIYHKSKKPKEITEAELASYVEKGWTTIVGDLDKRYDLDEHGNLIKAKVYPVIKEFVEDETED